MQAAASRTTVLLIEDNPGDARLIDALLQEGASRGLACTTVHAASLAAGIERLRGGGIDLVLLDLALPESSGLETVQRLRAVASRLPALVVLSGLDDEDVAVQALQEGAQDYLVKGRVDPAGLVRTLRYAIGRHHAEQVLQNELERQRELANERAIRARAEGESESLRRLLQEREEMLQLLAHEVRQPLHNAAMALQSARHAMAAFSGALPQDAVAPLAHAEQVMSHVFGTLNNALAAATLLTGGERAMPTDCDIDTLVAVVLADIGAPMRPRVQVARATGLRTAQLQPTMMRLALCNLLDNALRYSPPDSRVTLRITDTEEPPALCFEVIDEGEGIADALRPTVFERGTRGPNARPGTGAGLGLYIVRQVVRLHGGRIDVESHAPRGTVMRLCIPQGIEC